MSNQFYGATISPLPGEQLVVVSEGWDPRSGPNYTFQWTGRELELRIMQQFQRSLGRKTDLRRPDDNQGRWILQSTTGADETADKNTPLAIRWSLKRNLIEKNLWEHPKVASAFRDIMANRDFGTTGLTLQRIARMKKDFDAFVRGDEKTTNEAGDDVFLTTDVLAAHIIVLELIPHQIDFIDFLKARLNHVEAFPQWAWVLRKTITVTTGSNLRPDKNNVDKMFTIEALKAHEQLADQEIIGQMPAGFWLKTPCEVDNSDQGGSDKYDFEQEYWHAETYEKFIYGDPITS